MDLSASIIAKSDQMDYSDFIAGPRTATITEVRPGPTAEQPVEIILAEFDRPWRPSKSMRRVVVAAWGADSNNYIGRQMTLWGDPSVKWGGIAIGGIRLSHVSHITKPLSIALTESKGKRKMFTVQPLPNVKPSEPVAAPEAADPVLSWEELADHAAGDVGTLQNMYANAEKGGASPETLNYIKSKASK